MVACRLRKILYGIYIKKFRLQHIHASPKKKKPASSRMKPRACHWEIVKVMTIVAIIYHVKISAILREFNAMVREEKFVYTYGIFFDPRE